MNVLRLPLRERYVSPGSCHLASLCLVIIPSFVVELPPGPLSKAAIARYARAVRSLAA